MHLAFLERRLLQTHSEFGVVAVELIGREFADVALILFGGLLTLFPVRDRDLFPTGLAFTLVLAVSGVGLAEVGSPLELVVDVHVDGVEHVAVHLGIENEHVVVGVRWVGVLDVDGGVQLLDLEQVRLGHLLFRQTLLLPLLAHQRLVPLSH